MTGYGNSRQDGQLEELLLMTEQMQEELDRKEQAIRKLKTQLDELLTLNERLNSENRAGNIQALKSDLKKTKELLQSEKEKTHTAQATIEECRDKQKQAEKERDYALTHQKKVEVPVEKPVLCERCKNCDQTAYQKAKDKYERQREKLAGRYKAKTAGYGTAMFLLAWYSLTTTIFQAVQSEVFISDCRMFFNKSWGFLQMAAGWVIHAGKTAAQISNGISNTTIAGIVYWLIMILIVGGCAAGAGALTVFAGIKIARLYKENFMDILTIMVTLASMAAVIFFGKWIKTMLAVNLLFILLLVQAIYIGIKCYVKGWREARGYY